MEFVLRSLVHYHTCMRIFGSISCLLFFENIFLHISCCYKNVFLRSKYSARTDNVFYSRDIEPENALSIRTPKIRMSFIQIWRNASVSQQWMLCSEWVPSE